MNPSDRRPDAIERDIEETRARMESTLSSLEANLTPGQLFDRAVGYVRTMKNNETVSRVGRRAGSTMSQQVKRNPLAFALIGAGAAWWIFGGGREKTVIVRRRSHIEEEPYYEEDFEGRVPVGHPIEPSYAGDYGAEHKRGLKEKAADTAHELRARADEKLHRAADRAQHARERGKEGAGAVRVRVSELSTRASGTLRDTASSLKERAGSIAGGAKTKASDVKRSVRTAYGKASASSRSAADKAKQRAVRARDDAAHQVHERPLLFAGIALAFGAALGALLRPTRREDRLLGPRRDKLLERVDEVSARGIERAREVTNRAFSAAEEEARIGESPIEGEALQADADDLEQTGTVAQPYASSAGEEDIRSASPEVPETTDRMPPPSSGNEELPRH